MRRRCPDKHPACSIALLALCDCVPWRACLSPGQLNGKLHCLKIHKAADALADGQLLVSEESVEVRQAVPELVEARRQADMTHAATHRRVEHRLSGVGAPVCARSVAGCSCPVASGVADACPVPVSATFERERTCSGNRLVFLVASKVSVDLKGKKLFVSDCITVTADITSHLAQLSATVVSSRLAAEAIVVYDIAKPGGRNLWVAVLLGLPIVGVRCLTGASGPAITYASAIRCKFNVCMTAGFRQRFPELSTIITRVVAKPHAQWTLASTVPARAGSTWLVFAVPSECRAVPRACSPSAFMNRFGKPTGMSMGVCGL